MCYQLRLVDCKMGARRLAQILLVKYCVSQCVQGQDAGKNLAPLIRKRQAIGKNHEWLLQLRELLGGIVHSWFRISSCFSVDFLHAESGEDFGSLIGCLAKVKGIPCWIHLRWLFMQLL